MANNNNDNNMMEFHETRKKEQPKKTIKKQKANEYIYGTMYADFLLAKAERDHRINSPQGELALDMVHEEKVDYKRRQMESYDEKTDRQHEELMERQKRSSYDMER